MTYKIRRNRNLTTMDETFTARNWDNAVKKVTDAFTNDAKQYLRTKKLNLEAVAADMLIEIRKE